MRLTGVFDGAARVIGTCADNDGDGVAHAFKPDFDDTLTLIHRKGTWLTGCAQQHQRVDLGFQLHEEQTATRGFVKLSVW